MSRIEAAVRLLDERPLDRLIRNVPFLDETTPASIGAAGLDLFDHRVPLPQMVVRWPDLLANIRTLQAYCDASGAWLAPHGKTTMAPHIFAEQLRAGAWGITVATARQVEICRAFGVQRVLLANEVARAADITRLVDALARDAAFELLVIVDDADGVEAWASAARSIGLARPVRLLLELGMTGGRTGVRDAGALGSLARAVTAAGPWVALAGFEGYEGIAAGATDADRLAAADAFLLALADAARSLRDLIDSDRPIVSAGGSAYFDRVVALCGRDALPGYQLILRSGGYVTHDSGLYERTSPLSRSNGRLSGHGQLTAALELWGTVISRPEPSTVLAGFGHRDAPSRTGMPVILNVATRPGAQVVSVDPPIPVRRMDDHHAYVDRAPSFDVHPGAVVGCGISHPCEVFERWRVLLAVDESRQVIGAIPTFF